MKYVNTVESSDVASPEDALHNKDESLKDCFLFDLPPEHYQMFPNKTAYVPAYKKTFNEPFYILEGEFLLICQPTDLLNDTQEDNLSDLFQPLSGSTTTTVLSYITAAGTGVSLAFFLVHLVVFALVPDLHNLPGFNLASLCLSLFVSYLILIIPKDDGIAENIPACVSLAALTQFFFLASFLWMSLMAFEVFRSIRNATKCLRGTTKRFKVKKYILNSCICWGISLVFTAAALIADNVEGTDDTYKPMFKESACWFGSEHSLFAFFAGPVFTLICLNVLLFVLTAYNIFANRMKDLDSSRMAYLKKNFHTYLRLAVIMGVTWMTAVLPLLLKVVWLWYLFAVLNTFQGLFIFIAFTCTGKVRKHFRSLWRNGRKISVQSGDTTISSKTQAVSAENIRDDNKV
ncbi:g-protein coupled receptor Mth2 [Caerostris darwini]|uniref:G-protein coupled receptor Mth2 n=1 Tax=Caerostris darwini TaxID=1538125 RepID=A0AAV4MUU0_9ARAC|nr:g-protein coupled receptor Mth2 [Caerostris darwini]